MKKAFTISSPTFNLALPLPPLNHVTEHYSHMYVKPNSLLFGVASRWLCLSCPPNLASSPLTFLWKQRAGVQLEHSLCFRKQSQGRFWLRQHKPTSITNTGASDHALVRLSLEHGPPFSSKPHLGCTYKPLRRCLCVRVFKYQRTMAEKANLFKHPCSLNCLKCCACCLDTP